jgi:hypothetical protein
MKKFLSAKLSLLVGSALFASLAGAESGTCVAKDSQSAYYRQVCGGKTETLCQWDANCRWALGRSGTCEADPTDAYSRSVCGGKSETLCKWDTHCAWND